MMIKSSLLSFPSYKNPRLWFTALFFFGLLGMLKLGRVNLEPLMSFSSYPCVTSQTQGLSSNGYLPTQLKAEQISISESNMVVLNEDSKKADMSNANNASLDSENLEFWKQPDGLGYRPCLKFSEGYKKDIREILKNRRKYLMVVSGGMNQQRNQIVDAVVIARILGAALVVPVLKKPNI